MNKQEIEDALQYIELNYEFGEDCPIDVRNYMIKNNLVKYYDDTLMITPQGELLMGYSKTELRERYTDEMEQLNDFENDQGDESYSSYNEGETHEK